MGKYLKVVNIRNCSVCALSSKECFSDPYVRIDLNTVNGDETVDSVLTKTKKKVRGKSFLLRYLTTELID